MIILAIETSCDDTSIAILEKKKEGFFCFKILSNIVSSQVKIHRKWGGIYPTLAKRDHQKNLPLVLEKALKEAKNSNIDFLAVTIGPGLEPCLWTGINFAKNLSKKWNLPIVPVNHIEAHILANFLNNETISKPSAQTLPALCLIVSGGHTQLILMTNIGHYKIVGETRDDAAGECFDKTARILGLGYPGGPAIAKAAKFKVREFKISLPRPMLNQKNYDFSFSGLKTAVLYDYKKRSAKIRKSKKYVRAMAAEIERAIVEVLSRKTFRAAKEYGAKTIILGGGVAANDCLRQSFNLKARDLNLNFLVPPKALCTDNAAMTAVTAFFHWPKGKTLPEKIEAQANLRL
jgi:N6-L-threonylcarbamoyladenine synthase